MGDVVVKSVHDVAHNALKDKNLHAPFHYVTGTDPGAVGANLWWYDTSANSLYVRNSTNTAWVLVTDPSGASAPTTATYITQTPNASLSNEQALSTLSTGLLKSTTGTGAVSIAVGADLPTHTHAESDVTSLITDLSNKQPLNSNLTTYATKTPPSGNVVGDTDTQTLSNKTLSGSIPGGTLLPASMHIADNSFFLFDDIDNTKVGLFKMDQVSPGSTRTYTMPNASDTLVEQAFAQPLQNKTLDNTNVVTLKDANFTLQDDVDPTKQALFQLNAITSGQTRTYTLPDTSATLITATSTNTLQNKALDTTDNIRVKDGSFTLEGLSGTTRAAQFDISAVPLATTVTYTMPGASASILTTAGSQTLSNKTLDDTNNLNDHIYTHGALPTLTMQLSAGNTATGSIVGNEMCGRLTITPSGTGIAAGTLVTINFSITTVTTYSIVLSPGSAGSRGLATPIGFSTGTNNSITLACSTALTSGTVYIWHYIIMYYR